MVLGQVLGSLAKCIDRAFDLSGFVLGSLLLFCEWIVFHRTPLDLGVVLGSLFGFGMRLPPGLAPDLIESIHCPLDDMERIDTSLAVRSELIDALGDPLGAIAGDDFDR